MSVYEQQSSGLTALGFLVSSSIICSSFKISLVETIPLQIHCTNNNILSFFLILILFVCLFIFSSGNYGLECYKKENFNIEGTHLGGGCLPSVQAETSSLFGIRAEIAGKG